jgi:UDP-2,3-diacylglucosamine hydrolase
LSRSYFISDLHLDPARPRVMEKLADFLQHHRDVEALYVLGDLFESWVGDDDDGPLAVQVRQMLADFTNDGPRLYLMRGNRDFLLGEQFCREVGAELLPDPTVIELYGHSTLLMHGDSLCVDDTEYQAFRRTVRNPDWQAQVLARDLTERRALAAELRAMSGQLKSNKPADIMDVNVAEVARAMSQHRVRQLIHGHTHRPALHREPGGTRWVLGDWNPAGRVLEASESGLKIVDIV